MVHTETQRNSMLLIDTTSNPSPLGLLGFGMTTVLLNLHNAGFFPLDSMIMAMGIFYGGTAQVITGIMEWKKRNTFGTTTFTSYGLFWLSLVAIWLLPKLGLADSPNNISMGFYLLMWGIFTAVMFVGSLKLDIYVQIVFASLALLFFLLAISDFSESAGLKLFAGYEGILCGCSAIFAALRQVLLELYSKK